METWPPGEIRRMCGGESRASLCLVMAFLATATLASTASGQMVRGRLVDAVDDAGIGGAMMTLVDRSDRAVERVLTRSNSGLFELRASEAGEYRLRADRIGYATTFSDFFHLVAGDTLSFRMTARVEAVSLDAIVAEADRQCRVRPEEGLAVAQVWEEARKALAAAAWTQERGLYGYQMLRIKREMDRPGRKVESEDRTYAQGFAPRPYFARPADSLVTGGFARFSTEGSIFWAPDADVLLSDPFLDTHCFRIRRGDGSPGALVGLDFEPVPERNLADIAGTMWLDPVTSRLQWLDFGFVNLNVPRWLLEASPGGRVEFQTLPNGTWIVTIPLEVLVLGKDEKVDRESLDEAPSLADLFPGRVRVITIDRETPYRTVDLRVGSN